MYKRNGLKVLEARIQTAFNLGKTSGFRCSIQHVYAEYLVYLYLLEHGYDPTWLEYKDHDPGDISITFESEEKIIDVKSTAYHSNMSISNSSIIRGIADYYILVRFPNKLAPLNGEIVGGIASTKINPSKSKTKTYTVVENNKLTPILQLLLVYMNPWCKNP